MMPADACADACHAVYYDGWHYITYAAMPYAALRADKAMNAARF